MTVKNVSLAKAKALRSPIRTRVLEILLAMGPMSVAQIAAHMGSSPVPLYHHVKTLRKARLLCEAGIVGQGRDAEQVYAPAAQGFRVKVEGMSKPERVAYADLGASHARYALRRFTRAVTTGQAVMTGPHRNAMVRHLSLSLSADQLRELNQELAALVGKWSAVAAQETATQISVAIVMGPHDS